MKVEIEITPIIKETVSKNFIGYLKEFPGVASQGKTPEELEENLKDALGAMMEVIRKDNNKLF